MFHTPIFKGVPKFLAKEKIPVWIRHVLVPSLTNDRKQLDLLGKILSKFKNIEIVEVLPFHKIGEYKWEEMNLRYELSSVSPPTQKDLEDAINILKSHGLKVRQDFYTHQK
ncbi:MAG: hypothetical protein GY750_15615 [Lentisphaerae bacterium]|nr:hypothetical protein [Lentisphaerota bacterium]MCP4102826.1 hypothetical protein [Lentisphaerota bacterium]